MINERGAVSVTPTPTQRGAPLSPSMWPQDKGKLIGANGKVARSLRLLLFSIGNQTTQSYELVLKDHKHHGTPMRSNDDASFPNGNLPHAPQQLYAPTAEAPDAGMTLCLSPTDQSPKPKEKDEAAVGFSRLGGTKEVTRELRP